MKALSQVLIFLLISVWITGSKAQEARIERVTFPPMGQSDINLTSGQLYLPSGTGPFAAVVILHGCSGVRQNAHSWAAELSSMGVAALVADQFGPRGITQICTDLTRVFARERRRDTYGALTYLSQRSEINAERIAVMGFSNGGVATINALVPSLSDPPRVRFIAGIAVYPDCTPYVGLKLSAPLLVLIGEADDWTPVATCKRLMDRLPDGNPSVSMQVYSGAHHGFDDSTISRAYRPDFHNNHAPGGRGATVGYDRSAHQLAIRDVRDFVTRHLLSR